MSEEREVKFVKLNPKDPCDVVRMKRMTEKRNILLCILQSWGIEQGEEVSILMQAFLSLCANYEISITQLKDMFQASLKKYAED